MKTLPASLMVASVWLATSAMASPQLAAKAGCATCHAAAQPLIGPSWHDIAVKYKGQGQAATLLAERVRKGSANVWGKLPMPPTGTDKIGDADLKALVSWVLKTH